MPSARVPLTSMPTLRALYNNNTLKLSSAARYPSVASYLDRVSLIQGDITTLETDAIVNAANKSLLGGGGVDGAIHRAAGPDLLKECRMLNGCETGDAKITQGYSLPAKRIIHTVGPVFSLRSVQAKAVQLASCYDKSFNLAVKNGLKHIAFPSISTGVYGYPVKDATHIALDTTRKFLGSEKGSELDRVIFTVFSDEDRDVYLQLLPVYFPAE